MNKNILETIYKENFSFYALSEHFPELARLKQVPQNPEYHAEGDVYRHTEMVCEALIKLPEWQDLIRTIPKAVPSEQTSSSSLNSQKPHPLKQPGSSQNTQKTYFPEPPARNRLGQKTVFPEPQIFCAAEPSLLFLAAAFHDIGKQVCTRQEDGNWVSPKHTLTGAKLFREMAYREADRFGLTFAQREFVANAIRYHGLPVWFWKKQHPELELLKAAESLPLRLLYLLSYADVHGRKPSHPEELAGHVEWFAEYARELGVWEEPYPFANLYTRARFFLGNDMWQGMELYDSTEFDVILLSGLPLAGKDSWIAGNGGSLPVISLDQIREEMKLPPPKDSGKIAHIAMERAKNFLSHKHSFIWNATNITFETRRKLTGFFSGYGARVHILYLEAPYLELLARNRTRQRHIPENVLEGMIGKLEIPAPWEAYEVKYLIG